MQNTKLKKILSTCLTTFLLFSNFAFATAAETKSFTDVSASSAYAPAIEALKSQNVLQGYSDGTFRPEQSINRAEFLKILFENQKNTDVQYNSNYTFPDVASDAWYAKYVSFAKQKGIIKGYEDGNFKPEQNITYPEAFKIVTTSYGLNAITAVAQSTMAETGINNSFTKYQNEWFYPYFKTTQANNLFEIKTDLNPAANINRGETAELMFNAGKSQSDPTKIAPSEPYPYIPSPYLNIPSMNGNGLLTSNLYSPYRLPVNYAAIKKPIKVKIYSATIENELTLLPLYNWNNQKVADTEIAKMKLLKEFSTELVKKTNTSNNPYDFNQIGSLELPITQKGMYFISIESPEIQTIQTFLNISDLNISVAGNKKSVIWVTNNKTQQPVSGASVTLYNQQNDSDTQQPRPIDANAQTGSKANYQKIADGKTDAKGIYLNNNSTQNANIIVVQNGEDQTLHYTYNYYGTPENLQETKVYLYTDRPLYRPGQTVNFKAIMRYSNQGIYILPPKTSVNVKVATTGTDYNEKKVFEKTFTTDQFGNISGSFNLDSAASTGDYYVSVTVPNATTYDTAYFQVQAYKKDDSYITLSTDKENYTNNETVKINVNGQYFFGTPIKNQEVTYTIYQNPNYFFPPCRGEICPMYDTKSSEMSIRYGSEKKKISEGKVTLDGSGNATFSFVPNLDSTKDYQENPLNQATYSIETSTMGANNIHVTATKDIQVYSSTVVANVTAQNYVAQVGKPYQIQIETTDRNEQTFANADLQIKITQNTYYRILDQQIKDEITGQTYPHYRYDPQTKEVLNTKAKTDAQGKYTLTYTPDKSGNYNVEITALDRQNRKTTTNFGFYTNEEGDYYLNNYNLSTQLSTDKNEYKVGEKVNVKLASNNGAKFALLVSGKAELNDYQVLTLNPSTGKNTGANVSIPVTAQSAPGLNIYAFGQNNFGTMDIVSKNVKVIPENKKLSLTITTDKTNPKPGETVIYTVIARDENGRPVSADLSFALVDKALLALSRYEGSGDIYETFYNQYYTNYLMTTTTDRIRSMQNSETNMREYGSDAENSVGEGAKSTPAPTSQTDEPMKQQNSSPVAPIRQNFADTAYWNGSLKTDTAGKVTFSIKLPDNLTTWSAVAIANSKEQQFGIGTSSLIATKDVVVNPALPRFVTENDTINLKFEVKNIGATSTKYTATLNGTGFTLNGGATQSFTATLGQNKVLTFPVKINSAKTADQVTINLNIKNEDGLVFDTVQMTLPLNPTGLQKISSYSGVDTGTITVKTTSNDVSSIHSLKLSLSPTIAENLTSSIEYLVGYPYGCVEQTMSRFLPNIVVYQNRSKLNFKNQDIFKNLDDQVKTGLNRLYDAQHSDGGWGWWENDESIAKNTGYVMYGLTLAKNAGFQVDDTKYQNGLKALRNFFNDTNSTTTHSYLGYVLSQIKSEQNTLKTKLNTISTYKNLKIADHAYLAMAYQNLNDGTNAQKHLDKVKTQAKISGDSAYFEESITDYENMSSDLLTTAVALNAFVQIQPTDTIVPQIINYFNQRNLGNQYGETHALSNAVIALANYVSKTSELNPNYTYQVKLNSQVIASGTLDQIRKLEIDIKKLKTTGNNTIEITKNGTGKLYYSLIQEEFVPQKNIAANSNGFKIERKYFDESGKEITGNFKTGKIVRVNLQVTNPNKAFYTSIIDALPAGFEPVNSALKKDQNYGGTGPIVYYDTPITNNTIGIFQGEYVNHQDLLDDRTALFRTNLEAGEHNFTYYARVVNTGTFTANPAKVEMMYAPEISGNTLSKTITITE